MRRMTTLYIIAAVAGGLLLLLFVFVAMQVEDWSRDLTTNYAATAADAKDQRLRPIDSTLPPAELAERVQRAADSLKNWRLASQEAAAEAVQLHFVRTTPVLRFQDDIRVHIKPRQAGSQLSAESRSRIGKGDLGQNPRNLRELLDAVRAAIE